MTKKIEVFASEALPGELEEFPDIKRGWGTTKESTGGIPPMKWFNAIQKRTDEVINSIIEVSVKTVIDYGVKGDGSDESVALQDAINSGVVNVPDGMEVSFSNITIPKGTVFNLGSGSILRSLELDAMKFEQDVKYLVNPSDVGTSTLIKLQKQLPDGTKFIKVYRPYDQSQQWYDENSTDTTKLGYTADVYKIASIEGNIVTLQSPMEFELDDSSFVTLVNGYTTKFYGGIIASETTGRYMLAQWNVSDVAWYGTTFKHAKAGIRFNNATNIHWHNCIFNTETNSSSIALNYGTTDCSVTNSIFNGGLVEDAQFITFSGCRRIHSVRNKYYTDSDNAMLSGFYIGAKCIDCKSVDDTFIGGRYGVCVYYGAQHAQIVRPSLIGQSGASIYCERSQRFLIKDPYINYTASAGSSDLTWGALVIRDCSDYTVDADNIPVLAKERMLSVHTATSRGLVKRNIKIKMRGTGVASISSLMKDSYISIKTNSPIYCYQNEGVMSHVNFNECIATYMDLYHMSYSKVSKCKIAGNNSTTAIKLTGDESRCNEFIDNYIENHSVGIELPNTPAGRFTNSIHDDNVFNNVTTKIPYKVSSSDEPQIPYAVSRIPNTGFRLYVTTQFDDYNTARTVHYFRHSGKNSGKKSDWFKVSINEEQFSD